MFKALSCLQCAREPRRRDAVPEEFRALARQIFPNLIIVAGRYDMESANRVLEQGYADLVAFGRPFIGNPDLSARLENGVALAEQDSGTLLGVAARNIRITN